MFPFVSSRYHVTTISYQYLCTDRPSVGVVFFYELGVLGSLGRISIIVGETTARGVGGGTIS